MKRLASLALCCAAPLIAGALSLRGVVVKSYIVLAVEVTGELDQAWDTVNLVRKTDDIVRSIYVNNPDVHNIIVLNTIPAPD